MVMLEALIIGYSFCTFSTIADEAWNMNHPRPYPSQQYYLLRWEEKDFYQNTKGKWILRKYRKTDNKLKRFIRNQYWKEIMMYYNTNDESGKTLKTSKKRAESQEEIILHFFKNNPNLQLSPFDIQDVLELNAPITSVRRAITNLTVNGDLKKTNAMKLGPYGKQVHTWRLNNEQT